MWKMVIKMTPKQIECQLDKRQLSVCDNVPQNNWLTDKEHLMKFYEWNTFFRRNLDMYARWYFGFKLYPFQHVEIYQANVNTTTVIIGSRATAKSYWAAQAACCVASLYPRSEVLICSTTKKAARLIVNEKIKNKLMPDSPMLRREIESIIDNQNDTTIKFRNGSTIIVLPALDTSRGARSTFIIYEEFRQIDKFIVDSVISPMQEVRPTPFKDDYPELVEQPKDAYISSAWYTSHWMNDVIQEAYKDMMSGKSSYLLGLDYSVSLAHTIKTKEVLLKDKKKFDPMTYRIEYLNEMIKENTSAYFTYKMFTDNQRLKKPFYPRITLDVLNRKKNPYALPKQNGEIRIVSCDMAFVENKKNDNSIFSCIRLIPETVTYTSQSVEGSSKEIKQGYRRIVSYLEAIQGGDSVKQAIRIKQLFEDFEADYCVLDMRNGGINVYDLLAKVMYDEERDKEYSPWVCFNDEATANRIKTSGASPVLFSIVASQKLNSEIATTMRYTLTENKIDFLVSYNEAVEEILPKIQDYTQAVEIDTQMFFEKPFLETQELINECVELMYEKKPQTNIITISEQGSNRKDRYTSISYGNHFASLLEQDLLSDNNDYDFDFNDT